MAQPKYIYKTYPAYRYKVGHEPKIVYDKKVDSVLLADDWFKTPKLDVIKQMGEVSEQEEKLIVKAVDGTAAVTNMLLRVDKTRSKKDLYDLAALLDIECNKRHTLKQLRNHIKCEATKAEDLPRFLASMEDK